MQQDPNIGALPKKKRLTTEQAIKLLQQSERYINDKICHGRSCQACPFAGANCLFFPILDAYHHAIEHLRFKQATEKQNEQI